MASRKPFLLRLDPALYAELESWAAAELRSVNAQMEYVLRQAVDARKGGRRAASASASGGSATPDEGSAGSDGLE